jgi:selenocysteine lyase/cysteine desulfurase
LVVILTRRRFVAGALSLPAAAVVGVRATSPSPAATRARQGPPEPLPSGLNDWARVRSLYELDPGFRHFATFVLSPHSAPVRAAIEHHRQALDRNPRDYVGEMELSADAETAAEAARLLRTSADRVALTDSTTMGLGLVYGSFRAGEGDELLTTEHDHYSTHEALRHRAAASGARLRKITLYPPRRPQEATTKGILRAIEDGVTRRTRLLACTWVHSSSGVKLPLRDIADLVARLNRRRAARRRIVLAVDAAHALGTQAIAVEELGCDVFIAGCHKWLLGPRGTGLVWATGEAWDRLRPIIPSFDPALYGAWLAGRRPTAPPGRTMTPGGYHSFEHRWALATAIRLHAQVGPERISGRIALLSAALRDGLARVPGLTLHAPAEPRLTSGIVCCSVEGRPAHDVITRLHDQHGTIGSVTPYTVALARFGTTHLNTPEEVEGLVRAVAAVAGG